MLCVALCCVILRIGEAALRCFDAGRRWTKHWQKYSNNQLCCMEELWTKIKYLVHTSFLIAHCTYPSYNSHNPAVSRRSMRDNFSCSLILFVGFPLNSDIVKSWEVILQTQITFLITCKIFATRNLMVSQPHLVWCLFLVTMMWVCFVDSYWILFIMVIYGFLRQTVIWLDSISFTRSHRSNITRSRTL